MLSVICRFMFMSMQCTCYVHNNNAEYTDFNKLLVQNNTSYLQMCNWNCFESYAQLQWKAIVLLVLCSSGVICKWGNMERLWMWTSESVTGCRRKLSLSWWLSEVIYNNCTRCWLTCVCIITCNTHLQSQTQFLLPSILNLINPRLHQINPVITVDSKFPSFHGFWPDTFLGNFWYLLIWCLLFIVFCAQQVCKHKL